MGFQVQHLSAFVEVNSRLVLLKITAVYDFADMLFLVTIIPALRGGDIQGATRLEQKVNATNRP